jgi:hypothetical protein
MDGPSQLRLRKLVIEFQIDRYAQNRIELAYRRVETLAVAEIQPKDSVQDDSDQTLNKADLAEEIHG